MKKRESIHTFVLLLILIVAVGAIFLQSNLKFTGFPVYNPANLSEQCSSGECIDGNHNRTVTNLTDYNSTDTNCISPAIEIESCSPAPVCGNNITESPEECDNNNSVQCTTANGYSGIKNCTSACIWDICTTTESCGDGAINGNEECDGTNITATCTGEGFDGGTLTCDSDCTLNDDGCTTSTSDEDSDSSAEVPSTTMVTSSQPSTTTSEQTTPSCSPNLECGDWQECISGTQIRICTDVNQCNPEQVASTESQACVVEIKENCSDKIKNQNETGIDCGGPCEKKCGFLTIVGSAITGPIDAGKKFIFEGMFGNITKTMISIGILAFIIAGAIVLILFKKRHHFNEILPKKSKTAR